MTLKKLSYAAALLATSLAMVSMAAEVPSSGKIAPSPKVAAVGDPAPAFSATDQNGKTVNSAELKGKVVVLEWINKDCPIDRRVMDAKLIRNVCDKFKDKVTWLAIDSTAAHSTDDYVKTAAMWNIPYPILSDKNGVIGHAYGAKTTPHMFIIDTEGKLVYAGGIDDDPQGTKPQKLNYVDQALTELLSGKTISIAESKPYGCSVKYAH